MLNKQSSWFKGPEFLLKAISECPIENGLREKEKKGNRKIRTSY
jgi:hypothetical protein